MYKCDVSGVTLIKILENEFKVLLVTLVITLVLQDGGM